MLVLVAPFLVYRLSFSVQSLAASFPSLGNRVTVAPFLSCTLLSACC